MKKTLAGAACVLLLTALVPASDDPTRIWSDPSLPSPEALDRLNLEMVWAAYVPMDGKRDGFASIQIDGNQVLVQTRSGMLSILDAEHGGRAVWRSRPGRAYEAALPPAFNGRAVFVSDSSTIFALDRDTGSEQWQYDLRVALSAPLSADERQVYLQNIEARLIALRLPPVSMAGPPPAPPPPEGAKPSDAANPAPPVKVAPPEEPHPAIAFDYDTNDRVEYKAILSKDNIFLAIPKGSYLGVPKVGDASLGNLEVYRYSGQSPFAAPPGHSDGTAYVATQDAHLYAVNVDSGRVLWRYVSGKALARPPVAVNVTEGAASDRDLYLTVEGKGLARLNQDTGEPVWSIRGQDFSPTVDRFLAANPKFVYAADGVGRLLILDRKNGAPLSRYDLHDYVFPVTNTDTDRIYLAANNGLVICLRDKDYPQPLVYRRGAAAPAQPTEKPLAARVQETKDKLAKPVSDPGGEMTTFKAWRDKIAATYGLKIFVSDKAFKDMNLDPPDPLMITTPKADNTPLGDVIKGVVGQVNGEYTQVEDTLIISPAK